MAGMKINGQAWRDSRFLRLSCLKTIRKVMVLFCWIVIKSTREDPGEGRIKLVFYDFILLIAAQQLLIAFLMRER